MLFLLELLADCCCLGCIRVRNECAVISPCVYITVYISLCVYHCVYFSVYISHVLLRLYKSSY